MVRYPSCDNGGALPCTKCSSEVVQNMEAHARESMRWTHNKKKKKIALAFTGDDDDDGILAIA